MTDNAANLSVDFLVGFTIFMVAFIWVATLVPNLFLGVSSHGIDFDAVSYRTGVILAEDPGATNGTNGTPWELQPDKAKSNIARFGLAVSKETPNILSQTKVNRFFNTTAFIYPDDYRQKAIFGDYPYRFNISLHVVGETNTKYIGDIITDKSAYGYIRRDVMIKEFSNATINKTVIKNFGMNNSGLDANVSLHNFCIILNTSVLVNGNVTNPVTNPNNDAAYMIDPRWDRIKITIDDLDKSPPRLNDPVYAAPLPTDPVDTNLTKITFTQTKYGFPGLFPIPAGNVPQVNFTWEDGNTTPVNPPFNLRKNVTLVFEPGFFSAADTTGAIYINLTFGVNQTRYPKGMPFLNTTKSRPFEYNYNPANVTQPVLRDAVMEIAIW